MARVARGLYITDLTVLKWNGSVKIEVVKEFMRMEFHAPGDFQRNAEKMARYGSVVGTSYRRIRESSLLSLEARFS